MNKELLDKLKFQAAAQVNPLLEDKEWQQVYSEKFAELIVKECVSVAMEQYDDTLPWGGVEDVLKHFGVEE